MSDCFLFCIIQIFGFMAFNFMFLAIIMCNITSKFFTHWFTLCITVFSFTSLATFFIHFSIFICFFTSFIVCGFFTSFRKFFSFHMITYFSITWSCRFNHNNFFTRSFMLECNCWCFFCCWFTIHITLTHLSC